MVFLFVVLRTSDFNRVRDSIGNPFVAVFAIKDWECIARRRPKCPFEKLNVNAPARPNKNPKSQ